MHRQVFGRLRPANLVNMVNRLQVLCMGIWCDALQYGGSAESHIRCSPRNARTDLVEKHDSTSDDFLTSLF